MYTLLQVRDNRADWVLQVNEPIAGNYYPVKLLIKFWISLHVIIVMY